MIKINSRMADNRCDVLNDQCIRDLMYPFLMKLQQSKISISEMQHAFLKILRKHQSDRDFWDRRIKLCLEKKRIIFSGAKILEEKI